MNKTDLYLIIDSRCNLHCPFCIRKNLSSNDDMSIETVDEILDVAPSLFNVGAIIITGGEPTLHPDFIDIIDRACKKYPFVIVNSNGTFDKYVANDLLDRMSKNLFVQISLDGTRTMHDTLRGNGSYDKAIDNIKHLGLRHEHLFISTTVSNKNIDDVLRMPEVLEYLRFNYWKVSQEQAYNPNVDKLIDSSAWNQFVDKLIERCTFRLFIKKLYDFTLMEAYLKRGVDLNNCIRNCGFGKENIYFNSHKDFLYCSCTNKIIGNLESDGPKIIRERLKTFSINVPESSACYNCKFKIICNGGCPGYSLKVFGKVGMGDIRCPFVKASLSRTLNN